MDINKSVINRRVLMSGAEHFAVQELNPYSHASVQPDRAKAMAEHAAIRAALEQAGVDVVKVEAPANCADGIYTANWALVLDGNVVYSALPRPRRPEQAFARKYLKALETSIYKRRAVVEAPYRFSGQGDALAVGDYLLCGSVYRTDPRMHGFLAGVFPNHEIVGLQTIPALDGAGRPIINKLTGWPDSFFYDIDLAIGVLRPDLIAWCPEAFTPKSQDLISAMTDLEKIEVSLKEATEGFALNLISTGHVAIMSDRAPELQAAIEAHGIHTITPRIRELAKGGGYIRCTTLTLD